MLVEEKRKKGYNWIKDKRVQYLFTFFVLVVLSLILGIGMLLLTAVPSDLNLIKILVTDRRIILLNTLPILFVLLLLYLIVNRVWISFLLTGVLFFIIAEVNLFKMTFRDSPFVFKDILLAKEAKEMTGRYRLFWDKGSVCVGIILIIVTIACAILFKTRIGSRMARGIGSIVILGGLCILCKSLYFGNYETYDSMWHYEFGNQWKTANQYMSRGVVYSFIRSIPDAFTFPPENYDEKQAKMILEDYKDANIPEAKKVNIISIMLEAYCDLSVYDGIEFEKDPYENFHNLQQNSYTGNLYTNIFAGGTVTTERSFLTGYNKPDLDAVETESYVRYFQNQGYYTEAMHPGYGWFYDRKNINEGLGFDNFDYYENTYEKITEDMLQREMYSGFLSDYDFFNYIIEGYKKAKENGDKYFNFSVTYQNHGPYSAEEEDGERYVLYQNNYTEGEYNILNNYLSGIAATDEAIGYLYEYISQEEEPVILILFGDHKPWLGDDNSVYEMLDIDFDMSNAEGGENYYETPYLIYANEAAKESVGKTFEGEGSTISPMFLMNELFDYMEIDGPRYLNYLSDVKARYDVLNDVYVGRDGQYELRKDKEGDQIILEQQWVEYYVKNLKR